jgi:rhodanese-related sulfurtransferase
MNNSSVSSASSQEVAQQKQSALLLDVRTLAEFEEAHIEGAVLHPLHELNPQEVLKLAHDKSACFVICRSGNRARQAADKLAALGLTSLKVLEGGMSAWEKEGLPVNRGRKTISLERQVRIAAGSLVFIGAALAYLADPAWVAVCAFVGAGLVFAGVTDTCGMAMVLAKMPWNTRKGESCAKACCSL